MKKHLLIVGCIFVSLLASAQCSDLFFSEYLEGSSNNKAIEIYNPTSAPIDLHDYVFYRYNNGSSTPTDSLFPQDILAPGDVWVAGNPSAVATILTQSDTLHTITFFNGDDCLSLYYIPTHTMIDVIGQIGVDPGTNWPVGAGATSEFTLVRMTGIHQGTLSWSQAQTEYLVYPQNTDSTLGHHFMTPCCIVPSLQMLSQIDPTCNGASTGSIQVNATGDGPITFSWVSRPEATPFLTNVPAGTYTVIASGACGNDTMTFTLTEPTAVDAQINSQINPTCFGTTDGSVSVVASGGTPGYTYVWSSGGTNAVENGLGDGSYLVTVTDANGCTGIAGATITEPPVLTQSLTASTPSGCTTADGSLTVTPGGGTAPYTYLWSNGGTTQTIPNLSAGIYTCTVICANGCVSVGGPYAVQNSAPPTVTFSFSMDTLCDNDPGSYALMGSPAGGIWSGQGVSGTDFLPGLTVGGIQYVTYTYTDTVGCIGTATDSVMVESCSGLNEITETQFVTYPNPFGNDLTILFSDASAKTVSIYNLRGELVYSEVTSRASARISTEQLSGGIYLLQVNDGNSTTTQKIQKAE